MKRLRVLADGLSINLDRLIGKGGEGEVYLMADDPGKAVKLYTTADRNSREAKVLAMVRSDLAKRAPLAAFPLAVVRNGDGSFAGFVMRVAKGHRPIHELYAPGSRKQHFPSVDYRFLARVSTNIAKAFAAVHEAGCVVGDINHSGILISSNATAMLIDADSFQFTADGRQYLCRVGVPEYTPPELQGSPLQGIVRTTDHDSFGLAVVVFQILLMGRHPFVGRVRRGEMPSDEERIRNFRYVYAEDRDVGMDQPPGTPALSDFSAELAQLFNQAFSKHGVGKRPSAKQWIVALEHFEASLVQCADNGMHFHSKGASECAWCEMERQLHTNLFLPYVPGESGVGRSAEELGSKGFDLQVIWARVERIAIPHIDELLPVLSTHSMTPSESARAALVQKEDSTVALGATLLTASMVILALAPKAWLVAVILAGWGILKLKPPKIKPLDPVPFRTAFYQAKMQWYQELDKWAQRVGLKILHEERGRLAASKQHLLALFDDEARQIQAYQLQRKDRQLQNYLEGFDIARANIKGVGHAKLAALSSYGIDTAADVRYERVLNVPGFGDGLARRLIEWRQRHETRFVFNSAETEMDRQQMARVRALIQTKSAPLKASLIRGVQEFEMRVLAFQRTSRNADPELQKAHELVEQARKDLDYLGLAEPLVSRPNTASNPRIAVSSRSSITTSSSVISPSPKRTPPMPQAGTNHGTVGSSPNCPRCGSSMRMRVARKGRNAGGNFWGCGRYPSCKGTKQI
ncbi:hypothetical protein C4E15_12430 [Achromobacter spanius]|uniref:Protein kinase domain-containing protein n=1 Tax=Achromobacter spanius TaxID=217203 RepID=A0A2S5GRQ0_9BURK|nr:hypothetical protein [Achromobacter spanius]PPA75608.1 hypothetical protein C4E15_12430 [Achromobacter spanius]